MKKLNLTILGAFLSLFALQAQQTEKYYTKHVEFPENATLEQKVEMAARLVPSKQQLAWQKFELTAFLHFGVNTFTGREWGDGTEDEAVFNPTQLDAEQWVRNLKECGFKMVILTAKHHDGFCLWPTKTTKHSVASSPWKNGKGDVVGDLKKACDKYGMKIGLYLSPWDRNASCYGDSPAYNKFFIEQLTELLTNYGEVHEVWFDGANGEGPNGKKQIYDWDAFYSTIKRLQPNAVMAIMGDDVRWVGNESGMGRDAEWSSTVLAPGIYDRSGKVNKELGITSQSKDLGSRNMLAKAKELFWYPSEVDVSIRPGWFYHADQDNQVKSLEKLTNIYFQSVGYNSVLLLNIPPDRRGLIHENDVQHLKEFASYIKKTFADNRVVNGDKLWKAAPKSSRIYKLKTKSTINTVLLQEDISKGQRIESFVIEVFSNNKWKEVANGKSVGHKRLARFPACSAEKLRITIKESRLTANVSKVGAYFAEPISKENENLKLSDVSQKGWKTIPAKAAAAVDGDPKTSWKSDDLSPLVVDMGEEIKLNGFTYAPIAGEDKAGTIYTYQFYVSTDGEKWERCSCSGEFSNIMHNPIPQFVRFGKEYTARYLKLVPVSEIGNKQFITISELGILNK